MRALFVTENENENEKIVQAFSNYGLHIIFISFQEIYDILINKSIRIRKGLVVDALIFAASDTDTFTCSQMMEFLKWFVTLKKDVTMLDGRIWNRIPVYAWKIHSKYNWELLVVSGLSTISRDDYGGKMVKESIHVYRENVLKEMDNLGFIIKYEAGRYKIGPALKPKKELHGIYYFGEEDYKAHNFFTFSRDLLGIQYEVEVFEELLNNEHLKEHDLQVFFEQHPSFIAPFSHLLPQVRLKKNDGRFLIPDFILKPLAATYQDSNWEVLDLKHPKAKLLAGSKERKRLSYEVNKAIRQLRAYGDYFGNPENSSSIQNTLGYQLRKPKLAVLIGRIDKNTEELNREQKYIPDVQIVTYDEILEQQKKLYGS